MSKNLIMKYSFFLFTILIFIGCKDSSVNFNDTDSNKSSSSISSENESSSSSEEISYENFTSFPEEYKGDWYITTNIDISASFIDSNEYLKTVTVTDNEIIFNSDSLLSPIKKEFELLYNIESSFYNILHKDNLGEIQNDFTLSRTESDYLEKSGNTLRLKVGEELYFLVDKVFTCVPPEEIKGYWYGKSNNYQDINVNFYDKVEASPDRCISQNTEENTYEIIEFVGTSSIFSTYHFLNDTTLMADIIPFNHNPIVHYQDNPSIVLYFKDKDVLNNLTFIQCEPPAAIAGIWYLNLGDDKFDSLTIETTESFYKGWCYTEEIKDKVYLNTDYSGYSGYEGFKYEILTSNTLAISYFYFQSYFEEYSKLELSPLIYCKEKETCPTSDS